MSVNTDTKNGCSFKHFCHEGGHALELTVACANSAKYGVEDRQLGIRARDKAACLSHEGDDANLSSFLSNQGPKNAEHNGGPV